MAATLNIALTNQTTSSTVYAYITGQAIDNNNALILLQSDAKTPYYPTSPSSTGTALAQDCAIPLGAPGNTVTATIPHIAGGRIWFSVSNPLTFLLNPGPGLVEPAVTNPTDPNINTLWDFCEFTWNPAQLFANITYVDFVSLPIALTLTPTTGPPQTVTGMPATGLATVSSALQTQQTTDSAPWSSLIVPNPTNPLRILSPNNAITLTPTLFSSYYDPYIRAVWAKYTTTPLTIDTQAQWSTVTGSVTNSLLTFPGPQTFAAPSTADVFGNSSGPFAPSNDIERGALIARLCAALNRSTLLVDSTTPSSKGPSEYYKEGVTNHYARIVHAANADGRGYAFPFDDVTPTGGVDQSGAVGSFVSLFCFVF